MSITIKILQCRKCGEELYRKTEGEIKEVGGRWFSNIEVYLVDERYCSHCTGKLNLDKLKDRAFIEACKEAQEEQKKIDSCVSCDHFGDCEGCERSEEE